MKYRNKSVTVDAVRWFKNGDHPDDGVELLDTTANGRQAAAETEGKVVSIWRPQLAPDEKCDHCGLATGIGHGWISNYYMGGHTVCPGDWVIKTDDSKYSKSGEHKVMYFALHPEEFAHTYKQVEEEVKVTQQLVDRIVARAQNSDIGLGNPDKELKNGKPYLISQYSPPDLRNLALMLVSAHTAKYDLVSIVAAALEEVYEQAKQ